MTRRQNEYFCRFNETTGAGENAQDHRPVIRAGRRVVIRHQGRGKIRLTIGRISRTLTARTTTTTSSPADFKAVDENQTIDGYKYVFETASSCAVISSGTPAVRQLPWAGSGLQQMAGAGRRQQVLPRLQARWLCQDRHLPYLRVCTQGTPRMKTASGRRHLTGLFDYNGETYYCVQGHQSSGTCPVCGERSKVPRTIISEPAPARQSREEPIGSLSPTVFCPRDSMPLTRPVRR